MKVLFLFLLLGLKVEEVEYKNWLWCSPRVLREIREQGCKDCDVILVRHPVLPFPLDVPFLELTFFRKIGCGARFSSPPHVVWVRTDAPHVLEHELRHVKGEGHSILGVMSPWLEIQLLTTFDLEASE